MSSSIAATRGLWTFFRHTLKASALTLTIPAADSGPWQAWWTDSARGDSAIEVPGTIDYLAPNLRDVVASITFDHVGVFAIEHDKVAATAATRSCRVSMYFETSTLTIH
jgi:hypothetical protein